MESPCIHHAKRRRFAYKPATLYSTCLRTITGNYYYYKHNLIFIPGNILLDIFYEIRKCGQLEFLQVAFTDLRVIEILLNVQNNCSQNRLHLHLLFQSLMNYVDIATDVAHVYKRYCFVVKHWGKPSNLQRTTQLGFLLCDFLTDAGWYRASAIVIEICLTVLPTAGNEKILLEGYNRLFLARLSYCNFQLAGDLFEIIRSFLYCLPPEVPHLNRAAIYAAFSGYFLARGNLKEAEKWTIEALKDLATCKSPREAISVLRYASKTYAMNRQFRKSDMLIKQAILMCRKHFGEDHPLMSLVLMDYASYLCTTDCLIHAIVVYEEALHQRKKIFNNGQNLLIGLSHGELAKVYFNVEFSSKNFRKTRVSLLSCFNVLKHVLPPSHVLLASCVQTEAHYYLDDAMRGYEDDIVDQMEAKAREGYHSAFNSIKGTYGIKSLEAAKSYENFGRQAHLCQYYEEAEKFYLKTIRMKEAVVGPHDLEIAQSLGNLATLYNYEMRRYKDAEALYLRAIEIGTATFGAACSSHGRDYRGLIKVYQNLRNKAKVNQYTNLLKSWSELDKAIWKKLTETSPLDIKTEFTSLDKIFDNLKTTA